MIKSFETIEQSAKRCRESYHQLNDWILAYAGRENAKRNSAVFENKQEFEAHRKKLRRILGELTGYDRLPLPDDVCVVEKELLYNDENRHYTRLKLHICEGLDLYGILAVPKDCGDTLAICCHGLLGIPEHICGIVEPANYNDAIDRLLAEKMMVFLPQLVLRRDETDDNWPESYRSDMHLNGLWAGITPAAVEIMKIGAAVRFLKKNLGLHHAGICGLSYGGFYALYSCALLDELEWCVCSCYFNDRYKILCDGGNIARDWQFPGAGGQFGDAEAAMLICPRPLYVELGKNDPLIGAEFALREAEWTKTGYDVMNIAERFVLDVFDGEHEFNLNKLAIFMSICKNETEEKR